MPVRKLALLAVLAIAGIGFAAAPRPALNDIQNIVVIYAENRSFDNLYGNFPGADGLQNLKPARYRQTDRDGSLMKVLPPVWGGVTEKSVTPVIPESRTANMPNKPFAVDDPKGLNSALTVVTRDLWHRFYQNQMQIHGGRNDRFAAWADSGGLVMGHYDGSHLPLWKIAQQYTLADHFFMGAFGGSFLNHQWLICACVPVYPNADQSPARKSIAAVEADGVTLKMATIKSAIGNQPEFISDGNISPDFYAINTMQPPYQPSNVKPAPGGNSALADPAAENRLPPQTAITIGDLLSAKGVSWAWYAGAWKATLEGHNNRTNPNFQFHHQPFNYFASMAPGTEQRTKHLKDGGLAGVEFLKLVDSGALEQVTFYKPQGNLNEHAGYADIQAGDDHIGDVIAHLQKSPQWKNMVVIVTYDENGGFWDHVAPPKADRWGPGTRIPAIIISDYAKKGKVDHSPYDTTSILRLITRRFQLPVLPGIADRDAKVKANGGKALGDLTGALNLSGR